VFKIAEKKKAQIVVVLLNFGTLILQAYHRQLSFVANTISNGLLIVLTNLEELVASRRLQRMRRMLTKVKER